MREGFIKLFRKIETWEHYRDVNVKALFFHILIKANYEEKDWSGMKIKPGEFITSRRNLAQESGLTEQQVRTALEKLIATQEVTQESTKTFTLIRVTNWDRYTQEVTQKLTTTKKNKNILLSNDNNITTPVGFSEKFSEVFSLYEKHRKEKKSKITDTARKQLFKKFAGWGEERTILALKYSMENGWVGVFEEKENQKTKKQEPQSREEFRF